MQCAAECADIRINIFMNVDSELCESTYYFVYIFIPAPMDIIVFTSKVK